MEFALMQQPSHMSYNMHGTTLYVLCYEITDRVFGDTKMDEGLE